VFDQLILGIMKQTIDLFFIAVLPFLYIGNADASEMVYTPVNPSFGGNPNNGGFLLQEATDNNHFKGNQYNPPTLSGTQQLQQTIANSLYSQIASKIATDLGNGQTSGSFAVGNSTVFYSDDGTNTTITINNNHGGSTSFVVPDGI